MDVQLTVRLNETCVAAMGHAHYREFTIWKNLTRCGFDSDHAVFFVVKNCSGTTIRMFDHFLLFSNSLGVQLIVQVVFHSIACASRERPSWHSRVAKQF